MAATARARVPLAKAARACLKWIDQFEIVLRQRNRFPTEKHRKQAQEQIESARAVYSKIIRETK